MEHGKHVMHNAQRLRQAWDAREWIVMKDSEQSTQESRARGCRGTISWEAVMINLRKSIRQGGLLLEVIRRFLLENSLGLSLCFCLRARPDVVCSYDTPQ